MFVMLVFIDMQKTVCIKDNDEGQYKTALEIQSLATNNLKLYILFSECMCG